MQKHPSYLVVPNRSVMGLKGTTDLQEPQKSGSQPIAKREKIGFKEIKEKRLDCHGGGTEETEETGAVDTNVGSKIIWAHNAKNKVETLKSFAVNAWGESRMETLRQAFAQKTFFRNHIVTIVLLDQLET